MGRAAREPRSGKSRVCRQFDGETRTRTGGHHDFQSWSEISLAAPKTLQFSGFSRAEIPASKCGNCVLCGFGHRDAPRCPMARVAGGSEQVVVDAVRRAACRRRRVRTAVVLAAVV